MEPQVNLSASFPFGRTPPSTPAPRPPRPLLTQYCLDSYAGGDDDIPFIPTEGDCNITKYYEWFEEPFTELDQTYVVPATNLRWWDITNYNQYGGQFVLKNGNAMEVLGTKCREYLKAINIGLAGQHGPVSEQAIYDVMCTEYCNYNDLLRVAALQYSGCSCMELSTKSHEIGYSRPGDWCRENSGKILCEELDRCGVWECQLEDFSCPRQEYNTINVELRGFASTDYAGPNRGYCSGADGIFGSLILSSVLGLLGSIYLLQ